MNTNNFVIINGRPYDPVTGLPVEESIAEMPQTTEIEEVAAPAATRGVAVGEMHTLVQESSTLNRRHITRPGTLAALAKEKEAESQAIVAAYSPMEKPETPEAIGHTNKPAQTHPVARRAAGASLDITTPQRQRHAVIKQQATRSTRAANVTPTPAVKTPAATQPSHPHQTKSAHVLKNEAIATAMHKEVATHKRTRAKKQHSANKFARLITAGSASLAVMLLAGYFTYLGMPNISMKMAAVQSGIDATYPSYSPDGYRLRGPVAFKDGEVSMQFAYASGEQNFTLTQKKSNWNSATVREHISSQYANAMTTHVNGLTIYTYDGNATWVNGGILYSLEGNAPLSSDQIQRIATSM